MKLATILIGGAALAAVGYFGWNSLNPTQPANSGATRPPGEARPLAGNPPIQPPGSPPAARPGGPGGLPPAPVVAVEARAVNVPVSLAGIGTAQAFSSVSIKSQVDGQILSVHFTEGQTVKKGDLLFTLDARPFEAALRQTEAALARDRALLEKAKADLTRVSALTERDFATRARLDEMRANVAALEATIKAAEALVDAAKLRLEFTRITAPTDGRAGSILVHVGNLVKANDVGALVVINQTRPINVQFAVPESQLAEIRRRMAAGKVKVRAAIPSEPGTATEGELTFINNTVDSTTGTILLKATYANADERLTPGQFVNVTVELTSIVGAVVVPAMAVQIGQQGQFVFVVKADSTVEVRPVRVGVAHEKDVVIESGVKVGERVVTEGQLRLRPGARVAVRGAPAAPGAPPGRPPANNRPGNPPPG
jgi:multidrug efflux system membrane fusion protein